VHDAWADLSVLRVWKSLAKRGELSARMYVMAAAQDSTLTQTLAAGTRVGSINDLLTIRSVKIVLDGALGSRGAQLHAPYADEPGKRGLSLVSDAELDSIIKLCIARGFQVNVHAIGDEANRRLLDAFARAEPSTRALRFRDEHASLVPDDQLLRFKVLGVIASMQPYHAVDDGRWAEKSLGHERSRTTYAFRSLLDAKATLTFGSDWSVAPISPILGIAAAVTRATIDGKNPRGWVPEQKITVEESLRAYTVSAAYAAFEEKEKGSLEIGKLGDFAILSSDVLTAPPDAIEKIQVDATVVGGRVVYSR